MHELPDPESAQERCEGQIVRVTTTEARVLFERWCAGAATITVPRLLLQQALDLAPHQLLGTRLSAIINTAALDDRDVHPHSWTTPEPPPTRSPQRLSVNGGWVQISDDTFETVRSGSKSDGGIVEPSMHEGQQGKKVKGVGLGDGPPCGGPRGVCWWIPKGAEDTSEEIGEPLVLADLALGDEVVDADYRRRVLGAEAEVHEVSTVEVGLGQLAEALCRTLCCLEDRVEEGLPQDFLLAVLHDLRVDAPPVEFGEQPTCQLGDLVKGARTRCAGETTLLVDA